MTTEKNDELEWVGDLVRTATASVEAPPRLREAVARGSRPRERRRIRWLVPAGLVAAVAVTLLALVIPGSGTLTVADVEAAVAAPGRLPASSGGVDAFGVPLPAQLGAWQAVANGTIEVDGRRVAVMSYRGKAADGNYGVVDGEPLEIPDGKVVRRDGREFVLGETAGRPAVTWRANGRTCVLVVTRGTPTDDALVTQAAQAPGD